MKGLYRAFSTLLYGLVYPYARLKAASGSVKWRDRLVLQRPDGPVDIWLHAASVGEIKVVSNLIDWLKARRPDFRFHLTAVTDAGFDTARGVAGDRVAVSFFPLDSGFCMARALESLAPGVIVVAETEIWPNLIDLAHTRGIPIVLVNGRMSAKAHARYQMIRRTMTRLLSTYDRFFFKSEDDRERYASFGVGYDRGVVAGDMKFDAPPTVLSAEAIAAMRAEMGAAAGDFLLLAGSTRPGEEDILVGLFESLRHDYPQLRLVLAPRHLERLDEVRNLVQQAGLDCAALGQEAPIGAVRLVDRMGILSDLYAAADLAFVGGTLVDIGGHNILEPVWCQTPVVYGPSLSNVIDAAEYIEGRNYGARVNDSEDLRRVVIEILNSERQFERRDGTDKIESATAIAGRYLLERISDA